MKKKVVWITGATSGLGKSLSKEFAEKDWLVAASGRNKNSLKKIRKEHPNITSFYTDINNKKKCLSVFKIIIKKFGKVDLCIFCAGVQNSVKDQSFSIENIERTFKTNFFGTMNSINCVYDYFKKRKDGHISIVSSMAGYIGFPNSGSYGASKAALINFAEGLNFDLKRYNVRVSVICPGFIDTPMTNKKHHPKPMMISSKSAAKKIYYELIKSRSFEIYFPKSLILLIKLLKIMPYWLYFRIINIMNYYMKR